VDILSRPFPDHELLTPRERATLAQIVRGASSKEAARALGIGPRTVETHRENIMRKLGAKNTVDLVRRVLGGSHDANQQSSIRRLYRGLATVLACLLSQASLDIGSRATSFPWSSVTQTE
jgi:DNA-binding CsgD family transcriptional regulator